MKAKILSLILVSMMVLAAPAHAFVNLGFETGNLTGWTVSGGGDATDRTVLLYGTTSPNSETGDYYLKILGDGLEDEWVSVEQTATLTAGYTLNGIALFDAIDDDGIPYLDEVRIAILDSTGAVIATPFAPAGGVSTSWTEWSWTAPTDGDYTLVFSARNIGDQNVPSAGYFDVYTVPEPASLILLGTGLAGLAGFRRKKYLV